MMQAFVVSDRNHIFIEEERSVPFLVFIVKMIAKTTIRRTVERALAFPSSPELTALKIWMGTVFVLTPHSRIVVLSSCSNVVSVMTDPEMIAGMMSGTLTLLNV